MEEFGKEEDSRPHYRGCLSRPNGGDCIKDRTSNSSTIEKGTIKNESSPPKDLRNARKAPVLENDQLRAEKT